MPGPLPGQTVTAGTILGLSKYGTSLYGIGIPPEYLVEPMTAASNSYTSVLVTWHPPSGTIFRYRLLRNRYGFPVNENDGEVVYDTTTYPGDSFTDLDVSPGTYHYYGFYVLVDIADNIWIRSGFAGCLAVQDFGSGKWLFDLLPEYFTTIPETGAALTDDAAGNSQLQLFLNVFGWALDYLRTQYATYADHLNDARFIPLDDLWNLAQQVGLSFSPDVPAYTVRKATENFAHVAGQRGTIQGIAEEIALRTGYGADVHMGPNILLDDDQAQILAPVFLQYQPTRCYQKDECVWVPFVGRKYWWQHNGDGWWFRSLQGNNCGNTPPTGGTSNSFWQALYDSDDFLGIQGNIRTSNPGTWEVLDTGATNYLPLPFSATQGLGVQAPPPVNSGSNAFSWNALRFYNRQGSARTLWCRSVSRRHADLGQIPDPSFELGTTIAPANQFTNSAWAPRSWPRVTIANWMGGIHPVPVPAYWTPVNATLSREDTIAHTGSWAMQVTPSGTATPITAPAASQYANAGFESANITGWTATNCAISQSTTQAHGGKFSLQIAPSFTITTKYTSGSPSGNTYTLTGNPFVTGPQITAIPGATDTVTVYCYGTQTPAGASAFPSVIAGIVYYDVNGGVLQTSEGSTALLSAAWTAVTASATAPAGAVTKALIVTSDPAQSANADNWFIDDVSWGQTVTESWSAVQLNSPWITCPAGTSCTAGAWYQAASSGSTITAELVYYDAGGNQLGTNAGSGVTGTLSTWVNPSASGTAPSGTQYAALNLTITSPVAVSYIDDTTITPGLTYSTQPDQIQAVRDGIPVPWVLDAQEWNPARRYVTNDIVHYDGQPFTALRASTGSVPPGNNVVTTDWAPLSQSRRIRLCLSGYTSQNLTNSSNYAYAVTPFIEWYDAQGNYITRILARTATGNGTVSQPSNMAFDSFTTKSVISSAGSGAGTAALGPWNASFWNNTSLSGTPVLARVDPSVNFTWNGSAPGGGVASSGWSASWTTTYTAPAAGSYGFRLQAGNGGSRLIINGQTIIDNWAPQSASALTASITLAAGQVITAEIDYWNPLLTQGNYTQSTQNFGTVNVASIYQKASFPNEWILQDNESWTSPQISIAPGETLQLAGSVSSTRQSQPSLAITWLNQSGVPVGTSPQQFSAGMVQSISSSFTAPDGTSAAIVTLAASGDSPIFSPTTPFVNTTFSNFSVTSQVPVTAANPDSLSFGTVSVPSVPASAAQITVTLPGRLTDDEQSTWSCPTAWSFTASGTPANLSYFTVSSAQAASISTGDAFTDTNNPGMLFTVTSISAPSGGFCNVSFTPAAQAVMSSPDVVTAAGWVIGGFSGGSAWPGNPGTQSIGIITTQPASTSLGITYRSMPQGGAYAGIIFRYTDTSNYWRCDQAQLGYVSSGVYTLVAAHAQKYQVNDRMTITLNGNSVTVYRNGTQVNSATSSFNATAVKHGIINDIIGSTEAAPGDPARKFPGPARGRTTPAARRRGGRAGQPGRGGRP